MATYDELIRRRYELEQLIADRKIPRRKRNEYIKELLSINKKMMKRNGGNDREWLTKEEIQEEWEREYDEESGIQDDANPKTSESSGDLYETSKSR